MRYLFFDIEGANCYNFVSKMCTFGYVITDSNFKISSKIDVIINPQAPFDKHIIKEKMNAYPIETYSSRPSFNYFYKSIKNILEEKEQIIIGWAIENDVRYIYDACKRYNLKQIKYEYLDLQKVFMEVEQTSNPMALDAMCKKYNVKINTTHKSDDDAFMTMKLAKKLTKLLDKSIEEIYETFKSCKSNVDEFEGSLASDEQIKIRIKRRRIANIINTTKKHNKLDNPNISKEDVFAFAVNVIDSHSNELKAIIKYINDCGATCTNTIGKATTLICQNEDAVTRYKRKVAYEKIKVISYEQFIKNIYEPIK